MKKYYRLISRMLFAIGLGLMFISSQSFAQSTSVSGTIKDTESGDPIPGVNVVVKVPLMVQLQMLMETIRFLLIKMLYWSILL